MLAPSVNILVLCRLYEAHKKLQKVNQGLEDKMLRIVDKFETEKSVLARELTSTSRYLNEEKAKNSRLKTENVRHVHGPRHLLLL